jgi:hypothetical protein
VAFIVEVLTDPRTKKLSLVTTIMEVLSNVPREATKRAFSPFRSRLEKVVAA